MFLVSKTIFGATRSGLTVLAQVCKIFAKPNIGPESRIYVCLDSDCV